MYNKILGHHPGPRAAIEPVVFLLRLVLLEWKLPAGSGIDRIRIVGFILTEGKKDQYWVLRNDSEWGILIRVTERSYKVEKCPNEDSNLLSEFVG